MKKVILICFVIFNATLGNAQILTSSNLPIVIINTDGQQAIPDDPKIGADMKIIYHTDGSRNNVSDQNDLLALNYNGRIQIESRGYSSQLGDKKPYSINTVKIDNVTNNNVSILGMPKDNDWILNCFAYDDSFMKDYLVYNLSNKMGQYAARGVHCEVIVNGVYSGIYLFSEKIKVGTDRVNISKMNASDTSGISLTGGYITQCDRPDAGETAAWSYPVNSFINHVDFLHVSPKPSAITTQQNDYIKSQFDALSFSAANHNTSATNGYPSVIDIPSFVDFMIINELTLNFDAYQHSTYFHKDKNGKLRAGPVWDFNFACGYVTYANGNLSSNYRISDGYNYGADFWRDLFSDPTFKCYFAKRWKELSASNQPLSYAKIAHTIDSLDNLLYEARHDRLGIADSFVTKLKTYFNARVNWLTNDLTTTGCSFPTVHPLVISKIHYNPLASGSNTSNQLEFIELTNNSNSPIDVSGYYFRELGLTYIFPNNSIIPANGVIYLAANSPAFSAFYNYNAFGEYSRNLSNSSEKLLLSDAFGNTVDSVVYQNVAPWPTAANGTGEYLKLIDLGLDNALASSWISSTDLTLSSKDIAITTANHIYPNPSNNQINISNEEIISTYEIYDEVGRLMMSESNVQSRNVYINLQSLAPNTYIVKTTLKNQTTLYDKVVKL